jgi:hypothetical protein
MFESAWRFGIHGITVSVLDPLVFPTGGIFFKGREPQKRGVSPALVHNNYLIGHAAKVDRFKANGLWFLDSSEDAGYQNLLCMRQQVSNVGGGVGCSDAEDRGFTSAPTEHYVAAQSTFMNETLERWPLLHHLNFKGHATRNVLFTNPCCDEADRKLILVLSLGSRLWFESLVKHRLASYAARTKADLLVMTSLTQCSQPISEDSNACAKRAKITAAWTALSATGDVQGYSRVALVDDTILIRKDSPDVFDLVPAQNLGASVEDWRVRPERETENLMRLSLLKYSDGADDALLSIPVGQNSDRLLLGETGANDARWFNSGFLVLSTAHQGLLSIRKEESVDFVVLWDQGLLNARRRILGVPLHDLGYKFNWVGSFNGSNAHQRPFEAHDAFAVHATTGLPGFGEERAQFLQDLDDLWAGLGI